MCQRFRAFKGPIGPNNEMGKRTQIKVNLEPQIAEILDAVADEIGRDELVPRPSRSDLLNKAALLYIKQARKRKKLSRVIALVEHRCKEHFSEKVTVLTKPKKAVY